MARPGPGRPSRQQQALRREELLETALDIFLERGFEQTTLDEIAARVGMSKRTVYGAYEDKSALFRAAVQRAVERFAVPRAALEALTVPDLGETLRAIARLRIANVATPNGIRLQRILSAQAYRFPALFRQAFEEGSGPAVDHVADLLARADAVGEAVVADPRATAMAFLSLAVGGTARMIVAGAELDQAEIDRRTAFAVDLFLNGVRPRADATTDGR